MIQHTQWSELYFAACVYNRYYALQGCSADLILATTQIRRKFMMMVVREMMEVWGQGRPQQGPLPATLVFMLKSIQILYEFMTVMVQFVYDSLHLEDKAVMFNKSVHVYP